jgi:hypothetical protein
MLMKFSVLMGRGEWRKHRKASVKRITQGLLIISAEGAHNLRRCTFFYRRSVAGEKTLTGGLLEGADAGAVPELQ